MILLLATTNQGKLGEMLDLLAGLAVAVANIDEMIRLIRAAPSPAEARDQMMARDWPAKDIGPLVELIADPRHKLSSGGTIRLSDEQARAILELRLQRLTALGRDEIGDELKKLGEEIKDFLAILASRVRIVDIIKGELNAIKAEFSTPRDRGCRERRDTNLGVSKRHIDRVRRSDLLDQPETAKRNMREQRSLLFLGQSTRHVSIYESGRNTVYRDVTTAHLFRQRLAETDDASFRGSIVDLTGVAHGSDDRGNVDDAPVTRLHHRAQDQLGEPVDGFEVGGHDLIPLFVLHPHQQVVPRDPGVVDEDGDVSMLLLDRSNRGNADGIAGEQKVYPRLDGVQDREGSSADEPDRRVARCHGHTGRSK